jgi:hypothetical protein
VPQEGVPVHAAATPADRLLDELVGRQERITYKAAYLTLIGPADGWNPSRVREVVRVVERSKQISVGDVTIRLDGLVVNEKAPNEPSEPHFRGKPYTRTQWRAVFGSWGVRRP